MRQSREHSQECWRWRMSPMGKVASGTARYYLSWKVRYRTFLWFFSQTSKLYRARSLLYRRQILQVNIRWKALDEIYKIYMLLHRSDLNISANIRFSLAFSTLEMLKRLHFFQNSSWFSLILMKFARIFSDFVENAETLQLLEISRFQINFYHDYTGYSLNFRLNFRFNFNWFSPSRPPMVHERIQELPAHRNSPYSAEKGTEVSWPRGIHAHVYGGRGVRVGWLNCGTCGRGLVRKVLSTKNTQHW